MVNSHSLPDLPKRLASKIRAVHARLLSARYDIISYELRIAQERTRISEFEKDPVLFAKKYYRNHAVDSYPVQTNISRARENLEYRERRFPEKQKCQGDAERELIDVTEIVIAEVNALRPSSGRVPWPKRVPGLDELRKAQSKEMREVEREDEKERLRQVAEDEENEREWTVQQKLEDDISLKEWKETLNEMTSEERRKEDKLSAQLKADLLSATTSLDQVFDCLMSSAGSREGQPSSLLKDEESQAKSINSDENNTYSIASSCHCSIAITAPNAQCYLKFKEQLGSSLLPYNGGTWPLIENAIAQGIDWPAWWSKYRLDVEKYRVALGGQSLLRDSYFPTDAIRRAENRRRYELCRTINVFATGEVHMPDFFEVDEFITSDRVYPFISWMNESQRANYVIKSFPRDRVFKTNEISISDSNFWQSNSDEFEIHGLVSSGDKIPLDILLSSQSNLILSQLIRKFGGKASARRVDNESILHKLAVKNIDVCWDLRKATANKFLRCKMPPPGLSWDEFQSYRWQIRGMIGTMFYLFESPDEFKAKFPTLYASLVK
jgi:hypothetical protein